MQSIQNTDFLRPPNPSHCNTLPDGSQSIPRTGVMLCAKCFRGNTLQFHVRKLMLRKTLFLRGDMSELHIRLPEDAAYAYLD